MTDARTIDPVSLEAGRVNAPRGTTSEPVVKEPKGNTGESPALAQNLNAKLIDRFFK